MKRGVISTTSINPSLFQTDLVTTEMVDHINRFKNPPPVPINPGDIFVRCCTLAGDAIDSHGGRFRTEFLSELLKMVDGVPLLIGHQKQTAPIGRFFSGCLYTRADDTFILPKFYWPIDASYANDLRLLIDSGVYSEASISFSFKKPTCSVCGKDIRGCPHIVKLYAGDPEVYYFYDEVIGVHEGSIVYKGAEPGTGFSL